MSQKLLGWDYDHINKNLEIFLKGSPPKKWSRCGYVCLDACTKTDIHTVCM